jgi:hypothetical protein
MIYAGNSSHHSTPHIKKGLSIHIVAYHTDYTGCSGCCAKEGTEAIPTYDLDVMVPPEVINWEEAQEHELAFVQKTRLRRASLDG